SSTALPTPRSRAAGMEGVLGRMAPSACGSRPPHLRRALLTLTGVQRTRRCQVITARRIFDPDSRARRGSEQPPCQSGRTASSRYPVVSISCSPEAERQRRRRERRRRGAMVAQVVIGPAAIRDLIVLGWLRDGERTDRQAVRDAFV